MPRLHEMIESKYMRKEDIQEEGEVLVTIVKIAQVNVAMDDQQPELKWAAYFHEFRKPMVLNPTNLQLLAKAFGSDDSDDWINKKITLYVDDNVTFAGKLVGGLRVRAYRPPRAPVAPEAARRNAMRQVNDMEDDAPFA